MEQCLRLSYGKILYPEFHSKPNCQESSQNEDIFWHASFKKSASFTPLLRKHLEEILQQNEDENQERRRNRIQKTMDLTQDVSFQRDTYPTVSLTLEWQLSRASIPDENAQSQGSLGRICILCHRWHHRQTGMFENMENIHSSVNKKENKANMSWNSCPIMKQ